jgi:hypothetical protein
MNKEIGDNDIAHSTFVRNSDEVKVAVLDGVCLGFEVKQAPFFVSAIDRNVAYDFTFTIEIKTELI